MNNQNKPFTFRGKYFFLTVVLLYTMLFLLNPEAGRQALFKGGLILGKILPIFLVVILFTALLSYLLKPKQVIRHLGRKSGYRGWCWALAAGVISHGPMYAWYPLLEEMRTRGVRDSLLVTFFASRAIKVPLLPMMVDYFGVVFTLVLSVNILISALLQGTIIELLEPDTKKN